MDGPMGRRETRKPHVWGDWPMISSLGEGTTVHDNSRGRMTSRPSTGIVGLGGTGAARYCNHPCIITRGLLRGIAGGLDDDLRLESASTRANLLAK